MTKWNYIHKDAEAPLHGPYDGPEEVTVDTELKTKDEKWGHVIAASNRDEYFERAKVYSPYDYVVNHEKLVKYADKHWPEEKPVYIPDSIDFPHVTAAMRRWIEQEFPKRDRPKTLVLWGKSRTGKTQWARALNHILAARDGITDANQIGKSHICSQQRFY